MVYSRVGFLLRNLEGEVDYDAESSSDEDEEYEHEDEGGTPTIRWPTDPFHRCVYPPPSS